MPRTAIAIGYVLSAEVERYEAEGVDGPATFYRPRVAFEFAAGGRRYRGAGPVGAGFGYSDPAPAERYVAAYPRLTRVWVRYDPDRPESARVMEGLWRFVPRWDKRIMLIALLALLAALGYGVWRLIQP